MEKFEIGEIVIYIGPPDNVPTNIEIEVISEEFMALTGRPSHRVMVPGYPSGFTGGWWICPTQLLRKKKPPASRRAIDEKVSWDTCAWRPKQLERT